MQDLLNTLQQIKDQTHPTLTQSLYERHPIMLIIDITMVIMAIVLIITLALSVLRRFDGPPVGVLVAMVGYIAITGYIHRAYQYEMTIESERRVDTALMNMPVDEYTKLVNQVKLTDVNKVDDVVLRVIAEHIKDVNTPGLKFK